MVMYYTFGSSLVVLGYAIGQVPSLAPTSWLAGRLVSTTPLLALHVPNSTTLEEAIYDPHMAPRLFMKSTDGTYILREGTPSAGIRKGISNHGPCSTVEQRN